jgi:hypothetical protein
MSKKYTFNAVKRVFAALYNVHVLSRLRMSKQSLISVRCFHKAAYKM